MTSKSALTLVVAGVLCSTLSVTAMVVTAKTLGPVPLSVNQTTTQKQSTFDVTGESKINFVPDNAEVSLGISVTKPKVAEAQIQVNQVMSQLTAKLKELGVSDKHIKTEDYSVYPDYDYTAQPIKVTGYQVSSSVLVSVKEFDKINSIIDAATSVGITEVGNVQFILSDEKEAEIKKQAREEAISKAKQNATELSSLAGMKLGKIVNVAEDNPGSAPEVYQDFKMAAPLAGGGKPTDIQAGSSTYTYSVTLSYETL